MRPLDILTWHVHGSYLRYLANVPHRFILPVTPERGEGYGGRTPSFDWPDNVEEVPADEVCERDFDVVLTQSHRNWTLDRHRILTEDQRATIPTVHLEHDPPRAAPTDTRHPVDDPRAHIVHVTNFNRLMWDGGEVPSSVIEHGVTIPDGVEATGELPRALVVANGLATRGRRAGADIVRLLQRHLPVDVVGMGSEHVGGLGEVPPRELAAFAARYRVYVHPFRYTSLGLAACEAMMIGLPLVGLATTEMPTIVRDGVHGHLSCDPSDLVSHTARLLADPEEAHRLGANARALAQRRFNIQRFVADWDSLLCGVASRRVVAASSSSTGTPAPEPA